MKQLWFLTIAQRMGLFHALTEPCLVLLQNLFKSVQVCHIVMKPCQGRCWSIVKLVNSRQIDFIGKLSCESAESLSVAARSFELLYKFYSCNNLLSSVQTMTVKRCWSIL